MSLVIPSKAIIRSAVVSGALVLSFTSVSAKEAKLSEQELANGHLIVCDLNNVKGANPQDITACKSFLSARKTPLTETEKLAITDAACFERHRANHVSFYNSCKADLKTVYTDINIVINSNQVNAASLFIEKDQKGSVAEACAKGAATSVGTNLLIQGGALVLDIFGCAGFCSVAAAKYTISSTVVQVAVGCAGGVALYGVDAATSTAPKNENYKQIAPRPPGGAYSPR